MLRANTTFRVAINMISIVVDTGHEFSLSYDNFIKARLFAGIKKISRSVYYLFEKRSNITLTYTYVMSLLSIFFE